MPLNAFQNHENSIPTMKKINLFFTSSLLFSIMLLAFGSCNDNDDVVPVADPPVISAKDLQLPATSGQQKLFYTIQNPVDYQIALANSEDPWMHDFESTGNFIVFQFDTNEGDTPRQGKITLNYEGADPLTIHVEQPAESISLSIEPRSLNYAYTGGKEQVTVTSTHHWTLECTTTQSWVTPSVTKGENGDVVEFEVTSQNENEDPRNAEFTFKCKKVETVLTISQNAKGQLILETESPANIDGKGGQLIVKIQSNIDPVTVSIPEEARTWIKQNQSRGMTTYQFSFTVSPNETPKAREAVLSFKNTDALEQFVVKQPSSHPDLSEALTDDLFRQYILQNFDANEDQMLSEEEAASVTAITLDASSSSSGNPLWKNIKSLNGINIFPNLISLEVNRITAPIEAVDLRQNKKLISINFWNLGCGIAGIECSDLPELEIFKLSRLSPWDTSEKFNEQELTDINLNGCPQLTEIQARYLQYLKRLSFPDASNLGKLIISYSFEKSLPGEELITLDISKSPKLEEFVCSDKVEKLVLTQAQYDKFYEILTEWQGSFYGIWAIVDAPDISGSITDPVLKDFILKNYDKDENGKISKVEAKKTNSIVIDKSVCPEVARLNDLQGLDIFPYLNILKISDATSLKIADLQKNAWLQELVLKPTTELAGLNVAGLQTLHHIVTNHLSASSLDLSSCETLLSLEISNAEKLSTLTLKGCVALTELNLQINNPMLKKIDISECTALTDPAKFLPGNALKEVVCTTEQSAAFSAAFPDITWIVK